MKISVPIGPQVRQLGYPYLEAEPRELPHLKMQVGGSDEGWGRAEVAEGVKAGGWVEGSKAWVLLSYY